MTASAKSAVRLCITIARDNVAILVVVRIYRITIKGAAWRFFPQMHAFVPPAAVFLHSTTQGFFNIGRKRGMTVRMTC